MRRLFRPLLLPALFALLALVASACGDDAGSEGASASGSAPSASASDTDGVDAGGDSDAAEQSEPAAPEAQALQAVDQRGVEVALDEAPVRVVSVWDSVDAQNLLALGIEPVLIGRVSGGRPAPWVDDYAGIETYDLGAGPSVELLATYEPDLIVTASYDPESYPLLEGVAPLYVADNSIPWRDELRNLARLVGRADEAEALIAAHEAEIAAARAALADWDGTPLLVAAVSPANELVAFTDTSPISALLGELGLAPLVASTEGSATQSYSFELVGELAGDAFLLVDVSGLAGGDFEVINRNFLDGPIIGTVPAAAGGVYRISPESSAALRLVNGANLPYLLDELVTVLTGDPVQ
ncbi:MAG: ABC transporter substrate-binding protein [Actinomycetota bacterium]